MDRHANFGLRLALVSLLGSLAVGAAWIAEHADDSRMPPQDALARRASAVRPAAPAAANEARPRLFLARDRVRRLPPVHEPSERLASASLPGEESAAPATGPLLFPPEGDAETPALPRPATPSAAVAGLPERAVLPPPEVSLSDAMPECPRLEDPVLSIPLPIPAAPVRPMSPAPKAEPEESILPDNGSAAEEPSRRAESKPAARSEQLEQIAREADRHTRRGFELAGRNAVFAARSQFVVALRLLAQGLDTEHGTPAHSRALAEGLDAIQEADDFIPRGARIEADLDLAAIVRGHRTPVLKQARFDRLTPMLALKAYFTYAQERLAAAAANEIAGSMALHGLGKLHAAAARDPAVDLAAAEPKAVAFFQAALLVYPRNLMAANDLGVLLARAGNWEGARQVLEHAVGVNPRSASWQNLAKVYEQLGDGTQARHARQMAGAAARHEVARRGGQSDSERVEWLAPSAFAGTHVDSRVSPAPRTGQVQQQFDRR